MSEVMTGAPGGASFTYSIIIIAVIAVLTFGSRIFPFLVFGRGGQTPAGVTYVGRVLPPAVMITLIVYCLKHIEPGVWPHGQPELISVAAVALLYKFTKNNLLAMVGGTVLYMVLIQAVFTS